MTPQLFDVDARKDMPTQGRIVPIVDGIPSRLIAAVAGDTLFLHTNWKAAKGRILSASVQDLERGHWRDVVPQGDAVIEEMAPVGERLAVLLSLNAASRVKLYESGGKLISELALPDIGSVPSF